MAGPIRKFLESLVYAGLKPAGPADPLYLTNRTWKQKLRTVLLVSLPVLAVVGVALYAMLRPPTLPENRPATPTAAEIAASTPILPDNFSLPQNTDLQIIQASVTRDGGTHVAGVLKNNTSRRYAGAELSFHLTDEDGSQVGGASTRLGLIEPRATVPFRFPIPQKNAAFVLVREVRPAY